MSDLIQASPEHAFVFLPTDTNERVTLRHRGTLGESFEIYPERTVSDSLPGHRSLELASLSLFCTKDNEGIPNISTSSSSATRRIKFLSPS
jgi:hypothetical protein